MKLRFKILAGFLILAVMLTIAGIWSIYELNSIGSSVKKLLDDNYRSINAAKMMIEALERQDSGVLLLISGKWQEGRTIITAGDSLFQKGFQIAQNNLTITGEQTCVDSIAAKYWIYKALWQRPIVGTQKEGDVNWYLEVIHKSFLDAKFAVDKLMDLNDKVMFQTSSDLQRKANRATMPGIVAILSALLFSLIFSYFVNFYLVSPIVKITSRIRKFVENGLPFDVDIESKDEFLDLANSIKTLCALVKPTERKR